MISMVNRMKAALHRNKELLYALMLAVPGFILTISLVFLIALFARYGIREAPQAEAQGMEVVTKTPFQPQWSGNTSPYCYGQETHIIGQGIADKFKLPYEQIMTWFCGGNEFEDILLALQTRQKVDIPVKELLALKVEGQSWEGIWQQIGLTE